MNQSLILSEDGAYGIVKLSESVTNQSALDDAVLMRDFIDKTGIKSILVDARGVPFNGSVYSHYVFYKQLESDFPESKSWRIAVLASPGDNSHDSLETAASMTGYNARVFKNYDEARAWLTKS